MLVLKKNVILSIFSLALFGALFFVPATGASAQSVSETETFYIDPSFDSAERSSVAATLRSEGERALYYVEDEYWSSLSSSAKTRMIDRIRVLSNSFDNDIFPSLVDVFGSPFPLSESQDQKITILFTKMEDNFGGYFREEDVGSSSSGSSNNKPMFHINAGFLPDRRNLKAFVAHEFQHLINYNQNNVQRDVRERVWLNELMSEAAPSIAGLNVPYGGSNLRARARTFMNTPSVSVTNWDNRIEDYGTASMFANYILGHFGTRFYSELIESRNTGIGAVNDALSVVNARERFSDIFSNWVVASLVNNCNVLPAETFCYKNTDLTYNNLHIDFTRDPGTEKSKKISSEHNTLPWQGNWISYYRDMESTRPEDHIFVFSIDKPSSRTFRVPYAVYPDSGAPEIFYIDLDGSSGSFYVEDFGYAIEEVVVMPILEGPENSRTSVPYSIDAEVTSTIPVGIESATPAVELDTDIPDGALVRARGDDRIYIIKDDPAAYMGRGYKRWVQSAEIMDMYGHLRWEDVITVRKEMLDQYEVVSLISMAGDERVFLVRPDRTRVWISDAEDFLSRGFRFNMVYEVNEREFGFYR